MGERPLLLRALHEHRDRRPNALIDEDHESLFLVAKKNGDSRRWSQLRRGSALRQRAYSYCKSSYPPSRQDPNCCPHRCRPNDCFWCA